MPAGKDAPEEKNPDPSCTGSSLREGAEEQLARSPGVSPTLLGKTPEQLIHELQVHQIELEIQAEELRRTHLELEESRDKYLDLYEFAPVGYLTLSDKALIEEVNLKGASLLGVERSKLASARFRKFIAPENFERWDRYFQNVLDHGEKQSCTLIIKRGDDSTFPARLDSIRVSNSRKANITVRVALSDITYIRKAEEALRLSGKNLALLYGITRHDIQDQLMVLSGSLELSLGNVKEKERTAHINRAQKAAGTIHRQIAFTKEYEQIGAHAPVWQCCRTLVDTAARQAPLGKIVVKNDLRSEMEVFADPLVVKVFYNLMDNAARYGGKIKTIRFFAEKTVFGHILVCEDDGDGVVTGEKEKIFERGFGKNTGMGLFLASEILAITGLTIRETGEPGKGARFEIAVPKEAWRTSGKRG